MYYKHITIVNDDSRTVNKWSHSLKRNLLTMLVIINDRIMFIKQATGLITSVSCQFSPVLEEQQDRLKNNRC